MRIFTYKSYACEFQKISYTTSTKATNLQFLQIKIQKLDSKQRWNRYTSTSLV